MFDFFIENKIDFFKLMNRFFKNYKEINRILENKYNLEHKCL